MALSQHHVDTVLGVVAGRLPVDDGASVIQRSWLRCVEHYGLDPARRPDIRIENASRVRECIQQNEEHLRVARAGMEQLYKHVSDLGYVLLLTDAEGIGVDYIGNDTWDIALRRAGLTLGANWSELYAGTNGIGTCLAERTTLTCHRDDHFYIGNVGLSCTTTPLYDPQGNLMGALDVSALSSPAERESQHLVRHLTTLYGRMIEDANFMQQFRDRWILRLGTAGPLVDVCGELMLAFDRDGVIVGANAGARRQLRLLECARLDEAQRAQLVGSHLSGVFGTRIDDIWRLTRGSGRDDPAIVTTWDGHGYHASLTAPRIVPAARTGTERERPLPARGETLSQLSGGDPRMNQLVERALRLADKPVSILIQGETGTGKEVLARALHESSSRAERPFVAVNCASIPESLIESELFGYMPGTFTGARSKGMKGLIQRSDGGTLFLDEIGDMPLALQTRLLRVLSEREILPLGADRPIRVDLNVIAASHRDLRKQIVTGTFREDLYYRLCGATLLLPPLRERQDQGYLIERILREEAAAQGADAAIGAPALALLMRHDWPGNVRELRNALRFALSIADGEAIDVHHLPPDLAEAAGTGERVPDVAPAAVPRATVVPISAARGDAGVLLEALRRHRWNISDAARNLGLCRATIYRRMKRYGIVSPLDQA
ncbi:sigma-54-dependent Fis family transcriptional regulator [Dokdonella koreensis]|uniref:Transcriptional activator of acetoin dehydrogenase operon AcoR n=1 Tax=Dokdonella koreensis DS-123 TaxID=1300342 RepID=A0A160DRT2_9GAMM|nr:sigma-54-dependent Fis family transcriptional regulator [Dokdonella koreensis]ANB16915.1 Transcriptional activator of acetoin dehydrogenase operon AcoR [Dokdonella koreensis DS-123]